MVDRPIRSFHHKIRREHAQVRQTDRTKEVVVQCAVSANKTAIRYDYDGIGLRSANCVPCVPPSYIGLLVSCTRNAADDTQYPLLTSRNTEIGSE